MKDILADQSSVLNIFTIGVGLSQGFCGVWYIIDLNQTDIRSNGSHIFRVAQLPYSLIYRYQLPQSTIRAQWSTQHMQQSKDR